MKQCSPLSVGDLAEVILDLRLEYGDTDEYFYILQDSDYARIVQKYHCIGYSTMSRTVGTAIAMKMSHTALRERVGQEERYGKEAFDAFMSLLTKKLKDPAFGMLAPLAYFGGTYRCESEYYAKSNEFTWQPFYRGSETNVPMWKGRRIYKVNGQDIVEPYEDKQGLGNDLCATGVVDFYLPENEIQNSNSPVTQVYVDTQDSLLQDQIDLKSDLIYVDEALALKANTADVSQSLALKANTADVSQSLALKADLIGGLIPTSQLPDYVDDVLSFPDLVSFPSLGEDGKIYIAEDVNKTYRWGGSSYVEIGGGGVALGETSSTAYSGDRGKIAYDHSLSQGNPHSTTTTDIDEGTKLFFTESRVNQTVLTGLNTSTATPVLATDQHLAAIGKLQAQINNIGGGSSVTWVDAASIGTIHPAFSTVQFAKINGLLWIRGYCGYSATIPIGTTLFLLTDPSYHLDIPTASDSPSKIGEIRVFTWDAGAARSIQLKNVVNNSNKFSLLNPTNFNANEYNQIQPVALGSLITP